MKEIVNRSKEYFVYTLMPLFHSRDVLLVVFSIYQVLWDRKGSDFNGGTQVLSLMGDNR